tara:strand:- start:1512 stop:2090 length:579 start_codon:yes stop_codon:yes gene_type:complete
MANYEATRYDYDGQNITGLELIPTATIVPWTASSLPSGFLECNGATVSRSTYAALFAVIGTTYGAGDGATTFELPDIQDRVPVSKSPNKSLASTGGAATVATTGNIGGTTANATLSTAQLASHSHPGGGNASPNSVKGQGQFGQNFRAGFSPSNTGSAGSGGGHDHNMSATFTGDATSVIQPYLALIYIIKT